MARTLRTLCSLLFSAALLLMLGGMPLRAQLDPRLQGTKTDFLDLYQQSVNLKAKPEICTVFDFSGSMQALMFHPFYKNTDVADTGSTSNMSFTLNGANNNYTVTATANGVSNGYPHATTSMSFLLGGGVTSAGSTDTENRYTISKITPNPTTFTLGATVNFTATVTTSRTDSTINWTVTDSGGNTVASATQLASGANFTWTLPSSMASAFITATLKGNSIGTITSNVLVKPDGTVVTSTDAAGASSTSGFYGAAAGAADVRNWVRAASHARFTYNDGGTTRTVDFPIPWKILGAGCTGNPLSSLTAPDPVVTVTNSDGTTYNYGSGGNIEMDLNYTYSGGSYVMTGNTNTQTTTSVPLIDIKLNYVDWVFTGKYPTGTGTTYGGQYIIYDALTPGIVGGQGTAAWGQGFGTFSNSDLINVPDLDQTFTPTGTYSSQPASVGVLPARSRVQAVKEAAIKTWITYQNSVFWAFRFLDTVNEGSDPSNTSINNNSTTWQNVAAGVPTTQQNGSDSAWTLLNGNSVNGMKRIASLFPNNGTPLTYAMARALAQFTDPNSVFNAVETGKDAPSQCMNHFVILFTDGVDNNNSNNNNTNTGTPYIGSDGVTGSAQAGNTTLLGNKSGINRGGSWWNVFSFAGAAAHLSDTSQGTVNTNYMAAPTAYTTSTTTPDQFLPYAIKSRNGVTFAKDHRICTMTVGVSLGGVYSSTSSPKRTLFLAAAVGDPWATSWNINNLTPWVADPATGLRKAKATNFFDATNPTALVQSLAAAFDQTTRSPNVNSTANPNLPFVGASYGDQVYLGKFVPPASGGSVWTGDLLMFDTKVVNEQTIILDKFGNPVTTIDNTTAQWSAGTTLANTPWKTRTLYTRIPGTTSVPEPGLTLFTDVDTSANGNAYTKIKPYVATTFSADADKKNVIQFAAGGDTDGPDDTSTPARPANNRTTIMGDIIDSAPSAQEYNFTDFGTNLGALPGTLATAGNRFRLLLVGTNQGWLHAFGEVSATSSAIDSTGTTQTLITGALAELWAFMPTDFLSNLNTIMVPTNAHRFMVDGTPSIYFLDLPPSTGGQGNGVVDNGTAPERAVAIIGLRKGGRSYYALDIHDPFHPAMLWSLVPDEVTAQGSFPTSRILDTTVVSATAVYNIVKNFGFSSCTPSFGRISYKGILHDAVFLGGGLSMPEIEVKFPVDGNGNYPALGRSIIALDVYSGKVLAAIDMTATNIAGSPVYGNKFLTSLGPISAGVVPFEYFLGSGMAQRAYFMDNYGGLWAMGSKAMDAGTTSSTYQYRIDSSDMTAWTSDGSTATSSGNGFAVRKVYQDDHALNVYTAPPAPFRAGTFPGAGKTSTLAPPTAVGIAMVSGDRNNPLDYQYPTGSVPSQYRMTLVWDRQDSHQWGLDTQNGPDGGVHDTSTTKELLDVSNFAISDTVAAPDQVTPGKATYYLNPTSGNPYFGYYINFPARDSKGFIPKGINAPIVVGGSIYYTYFWPATADPCTGGSGNSYSQFLADLYNPAPVDTRTTVQATSGNKFTWSGVASDYVAFGTTGTIQGGVVPVGGVIPPGASATTLQLVTLRGRQQERHPKARVWRSVP